MKLISIILAFAFIGLACSSPRQSTDVRREATKQDTDSGLATLVWQEIPSARLEHVSNLFSADCREDALFISVMLTQGNSGGYKFSLQQDHDGWSQIYDQVAHISATDKGVAAAFDPSNT